MPNRHSKSFIQNRFGQTCKDDSFYLLDVLSKTWKVLDCPGIGERTYHSASLIRQNTLVVLGGVRYEDFTPVKRYDISTINLITLDFEKCRVVKCRYLRQRWISQSTFLITALLLWINLSVFMADIIMKDQTSASPAIHQTFI